MSTKKKTEVSEVKKSMVDSIMSKVNVMKSDGLRLPKNYSAQNAMRSAWLILQETQTRSKQPVLTACSRNSIANSLLAMVVKGLDPQKKQCYFIAYGNKLQLMESYFGKLAIGKRAGLKDVKANVIRKGDDESFDIF